MRTERVLRTELLKPEREDHRESPEALVEQDTKEVVTTSSGVVLYVLQSIDDE